MDEFQPTEVKMNNWFDKALWDRRWTNQEFLYICYAEGFKAVTQASVSLWRKREIPKFRHKTKRIIGEILYKYPTGKEEGVNEAIELGRELYVKKYGRRERKKMEVAS